MEFEWDPRKATSNRSNHGVSFEEAATVFDDALFLVFEDPNHSIDEHRFLIMGTSAQGRLLVVAHTEIGNAVRIISAREATRTERVTYEEGL